ncbi:MAG: proteasome accessory factor PafA2 family protein [Bradymonadia bacterium]
MLTRLSGLETEYAVRYTARDALGKPDHRLIYQALVSSLGQHTALVPARRRTFQQKYFTSNGGSICYEHLPTHPTTGLFEGGTPECRGPLQLLMYQRAQEQLLRSAIPFAQAQLAHAGYHGELALIRNARDAFGNIYGPQESYEIAGPTGYRRTLFRIIATLALLWLPFGLGLMLALALPLACLALGAHIINSVAVRISRIVRSNKDGTASLQNNSADFHRRLAYAAYLIQTVSLAPALILLNQGLNRLVFDRLREQMASFIVSRTIFAGTGVLDDRFGFQLCEKAIGIERYDRSALSMEGRSVFDNGHLLKCLVLPFLGDFEVIRLLFNDRIRMQLGLGESNRLDVAEFVKLGSTMLVIDMIEAGYLAEAPRVSSPIDALHAISADPNLGIAVYMQNGDYQTGLELQRWYQNKARQFVEASTVKSPESSKVVALWGELLDQLENKSTTLVGHIDWVTKYHLIEQSGEALTLGEKKKIDIKYHELGSGYADWLVDEGLTIRLADDESIQHAVSHPPSDTPAWARGLFVNAAQTSHDVSVTWLGAYKGTFGGKQIIDFPGDRETRT